MSETARPILALNRWEPWTYYPAGEKGPAITMELRRVRRHEVKPLRVAVTEALEELNRGRDDALTPAQKVAVMSNIFEKVPEAELEALFSENVRNVDGLSYDGVVVRTGAQLLDVADDDLIFTTILELNRLSGLAPAEAFRSASRSTSSVAEASTPASSSEDASTTAREASPAPSTATPPTTVTASSSVPVGA